MRSNIHTTSGAKYACSKNLGTLCKELDKAKMICRVHTSFAVNLLRIERIQKDKQGLIIMTERSVVPISRRRKSELYKKYVDTHAGLK
jgi:DNA-binding LytR/AlgR family response regulator